jgi:hypothetical protein
MGVFSAVAGLPLAPVRMLLALADVLEAEAERQLYDPARVRRELEEIEATQEMGAVSPEEAGRQTQRALDRLIRPETGAG